MKTRLVSLVLPRWRWSVSVALLIVGCGKAHDPDGEPTRQELRPPPFETPECAATASTAACADVPEVLGVEACSGIAGYDFLQVVVALGERTSAAVSAPEPGMICLSGTLGLTLNYSEGLTVILYVSPRDRTETCILSAFDAQGLGVAAFKFDLDNVPDVRASVSAAVIRQPQCDEDWQCADGGIYTWLTPDRQELGVVQAGTNVVRLDELVGDDLPEPIGAYWLSDFGLDLSASGVDLPFELCLSNIQLLDSAGNVVLPAPD
jgi:hypothetical protein